MFDDTLFPGIHVLYGPKNYGKTTTIFSALNQLCNSYVKVGINTFKLKTLYIDGNIDTYYFYK